MELAGKPSQDLPDVLAAGGTDARYVFLSMSARETDGRDAEYIAWHSLDHRPEQYRLEGLRNALRLVSTPDCRRARAASSGPYDDVDHIMTYMFTSSKPMTRFAALGAALAEGGRMPLLLRQVGHLTGDLAGIFANPRAVAGADVIPWRPCTGAYLVIEKADSRPAPAPTSIDMPGIAGAWCYDGTLAPSPFSADARDKRITVYFLDADPVAVARPLGEAIRRRWQDGGNEGLLAAPFHAVVPFAWDRYLP